jgi:prepilin peptidase CpaA
MAWSLGAAVAVAAIAAWLDLRTGHIPNWLTFGAIGGAPLAHLLVTLAQTGQRVEALEDAGFALVGAVVCAILPVGLLRASAMGGGDVKLFIALGAILRPLAGIEAEVWSFCAAAVVAPFWLAYEGKLFRTVANAAYLLANPMLPKDRRRELDPSSLSWFRMGPAILLGTLLTASLHVHE